MIRILWLTNIILPKIAQEIGEHAGNGGGWIIGMFDQLKKNKDIEIVYCFCLLNRPEVVKGKIDNVKYYGVPKRYTNPTKYDENLERYFCNILEKETPDLVHIFGTEYAHTLAMVNVCREKKIKTVISIQGLVSIIAQHYMASLPAKIQKKFTFRDFLRQDNLQQQQKKFVIRGKIEIEALKKVKHIIGRTTWDKACTSWINPDAKYHFCNETLREEFYRHKWNIDECEQHSIFLSQAAYPIKGLHFMLEAMPLILSRYPDAKLYIAGNNRFKVDTLKAKLRMSSYGKYIKSLIEKYNLHNHMEFTGLLNEEQMCARYLKSNVFVSPSIVENESNSVSEAKILGVPCVASYVGGVIDRIQHKEDGFVYQTDAPYMLAHYVCEIFRDKNQALKFSENARKHAMKTHDKDENTNRLVSIYNDILD